MQRSPSSVVKRVTLYKQSGIVTGMQGWFHGTHHTKKLKKNHLIISLKVKKSVEEISTSVYAKTFSKLNIEVFFFL